MRDLGGMLLVLLGAAAGPAPGDDACSGVAICSGSGSSPCRAVHLRTSRSCGREQLSCTTRICVLTEAVGNVSAPAVVGIEGATRKITNDTAPTWRTVSK
jgi:hypothetical protein